MQKAPKPPTLPGGEAPRKSRGLSRRTTQVQVVKEMNVPQAPVFSDHAETDDNHPKDPEDREDCSDSPVAVLGSGGGCARVMMTRACDSAFENTVEFSRVQHIDRTVCDATQLAQAEYTDRIARYRSCDTTPSTKSSRQCRGWCWFVRVTLLEPRSQTSCGDAATELQ